MSLINFVPKVDFVFLSYIVRNNWSCCLATSKVSDVTAVTTASVEMPRVHGLFLGYIFQSKHMQIGHEVNKRH